MLRGDTQPDGGAFLRKNWLALIVFVGAATLFLGDVLFLDKSLGAFDIILKQPGWQSEYLVDRVQQPILLDSPTAHYPQRRLDWGSVRQGHNPNYNPYIVSGMAWGPQGVGAFVTSLPQLFLDIGDAIDWSTWFRLILAGFFMYLLLMELGVGAIGSIFGGVLWTYNLHQIVWLEFPQHLATQLWMPLLMLLNVLTLRSRFQREYVIGLVVVNVLFFTSGYTQIVLYTFIFIALFNTLFIFFVESDTGWTANLKRWLHVHVLYVVGFVFYGIGALIEAQMISEGLRGLQGWRGQPAQANLDIDTLFSFLGSLVPPLEEVKRFYTPDYFGGIWTGNYRRAHGNLVEDSGYLGVLAVLLVLYLIVTIKTADDWRLRITFLALSAIGFSLFYRNPVAISALNVIPFAGKGNYGRFLTLIIFFGSILAAMGLKSFCEAFWRRDDRALWFAIGLFVFLPILGEFMIEEFRLHRFGYALLISGILLIGAYSIRRCTSSVKWLGVFIVLLTAVDLFLATYGFNSRLDNDKQFPTNNAIRFLLNDRDIFRVTVVSDKPMYTPNVLSFYQIPTVEGYSTVLPNQYVKFVRSAFSQYHITNNGMLLFHGLDVRPLRLLNVKYVVTSKTLHDENLIKVFEDDEQTIYQIKNWLPRVYCASDVIVRDHHEVVNLGKIINQYDRPAVLHERVQVSNTSCEVQALNVYTNNLDFQVEATGDALVMLPHVFSTNWHASVDDRRARILRINEAFMGLVVPQGRSQVRVYYENKWQAISAVVLMIGALLVIVFMMRSQRRVLQGTLIVCCVLILGKSALSLPGLRNDNIPERLFPTKPLLVEKSGHACVEKAGVSPRIGREHPWVVPLEIPVRGLIRLQLLAATYLQPVLSYAVTVSLRDSDGQILRQQTVPAHSLRDNSWFQVRFSPISEERPVKLEISSQNADSSKDFSVWLDAQGGACMKAYYGSSIEARS